MRKKLFGTDGIRGEVNKFPIKNEYLQNIAVSIINSQSGKIKNVIIGKDTRDSCDMIEKALASGFNSLNVGCSSIGIVSTPILSFYTKKLNFSLGIMISASHNPYMDNGIKLFDGNGEKITEEVEEKIENYFFSSTKKSSLNEKLDFLKINLNEYEDFLKINVPGNLNIRGMKIYLDCANGSLSKIAPEIFRKLGADVLFNGCNPNGFNINNNCGAMFPKILSENTVKTNSDIGFSYDGDADRVIISDEKGKILDGDDILVSVSTYLKKKELLDCDHIVTTKMSNLGFREYLQKKGINVFLTKVGDKNVIEEMKRIKATIGGEQSGHTIFASNGYCGDGLLTSFFMLAIMREFNCRCSKIGNLFKKYPQKLINIKLKVKPEKIIKNKDLINIVDEFLKNKKFKTEILIRRSGTENLVRLMVQCNDKSQLQFILNVVQKKINEINNK